MTGIKATWLESWAQERGLAFLRFDYRGHGASSGDFEELGIGDWAKDACAAITELTYGPQVLVGSSMGGWISLLAARRLAGRVAGLVGIAAAPDFTEHGAKERLSPAQRDEMMRTGRVEVPSAYSDAPYVYTRRLFEDGRRNLVLASPYRADFPIRLLHGTADVDVSPEMSLKVLEHVDAEDVRVTLVKGSDHRFSGPRELALIGRAIEEVLGAQNGSEAPA